MKTYQRYIIERIYSPEELAIFENRYKTAYSVFRGNYLRSKKNRSSLFQDVSTDNLGIWSLRKLGKKYGISGERVRQLLKREGIKSLFREKRQQYKEKQLLKIAYNCKACSKQVSYKEKNGHRYLCKNCSNMRVKEQRNPFIRHTCSQCGNSFHPFVNYGKQRHKGLFCSQKCYMKTDQFRKMITEIHRRRIKNVMPKV